MSSIEYNSGKYDMFRSKRLPVKYIREKVLFWVGYTSEEIELIERLMKGRNDLYLSDVLVLDRLVSGMEEAGLDLEQEKLRFALTLGFFTLEEERRLKLQIAKYAISYIDICDGEYGSVKVKEVLTRIFEDENYWQLSEVIESFMVSIKELLLKTSWAETGFSARVRMVYNALLAIYYAGNKRNTAWETTLALLGAERLASKIGVTVYGGEADLRKQILTKISESFE